MPPSADQAPHQLRHRVAVIDAAGGLGQGILRVCRAQGIAFTAIVRSRPERIVDVPQGSRVAVVASLTDRAALTKALSGARADVVLTALGVTPTSKERSAMLSENAAEVQPAMLAARVDRIITPAATTRLGRGSGLACRALNSWMPVSYDAMARWMIQQATLPSLFLFLQHHLS